MVALRLLKKIGNIFEHWQGYLFSLSSLFFFFFKENRVQRYNFNETLKIWLEAETKNEKTSIASNCQNCKLLITADQKKSNGKCASSLNMKVFLGSSCNRHTHTCTIAKQYLAYLSETMQRGSYWFSLFQIIIPIKLFWKTQDKKKNIYTGVFLRGS